MMPADVSDFVTWAAVGLVVGGRLAYVLFYDLPRFFQNPLDIFAVWQGGMSFHGGFAGTVIAMLLFTRLRKISVFSLMDAVAAGAPVGLGLVKVANFVNSELWGKVTTVPWAFVFPNGGPLPRNPSQIYEALLEGVLLFLILRFLTHVRRS